jgi:hypothetical protein
MWIRNLVNEEAVAHWGAVAPKINKNRLVVSGHLSLPSSKAKESKNTWHVCRTETSVTNYQSLLRKIPEWKKISSTQIVELLKISRLFFFPSDRIQKSTIHITSRLFTYARLYSENFKLGINSFYLVYIAKNLIIACNEKYIMEHKPNLQSAAQMNDTRVCKSHPVTGLEWPRGFH